MKGMRNATIWTLAAMVSFAISLWPPFAHFADIPALAAVMAFVLALFCSLRSLGELSLIGRVGVVALAGFQLSAAVFVGWVLMLSLR
jgi:hypothetical protein